jgi:prepilin-type N-terminal cleavage/methylation domain-containing protein
MKRRAFTLIELLFTLALLGIFSLVATRLTSMSIRLMRDLPAQTDLAVRIDRASDQLTRDTWPANKIEVSGRELILTSTNHTLRWTLGANGAIIRSAAEGLQTWEGVAPSGSFSTYGPLVTLSSSLGTLKFYSEPIRLGGQP